MILPTRVLGAQLIVARPGDGGPVVLPPTAATVVDALAEWRSVDEVDAVLADVFAEVDAHERHTTLHSLLDRLEAEGLVERR